MAAIEAAIQDGIPRWRLGAGWRGQTPVRTLDQEERTMAGILQISPRAADYKARVERFMDEHIYPNEQKLYEVSEHQPDKWEPLALIEELKGKAKADGLWNLFLPDSELRSEER